jgi:hypothetical protein
VAILGAGDGRTRTNELATSRSRRKKNGEEKIWLRAKGCRRDRTGTRRTKEERGKEEREGREGRYDLAKREMGRKGKKRPERGEERRERDDTRQKGKRIGTARGEGAGGAASGEWTAGRAPLLAGTRCTALEWQGPGDCSSAPVHQVAAPQPIKSRLAVQLRDVTQPISGPGCRRVRWRYLRSHQVCGGSKVPTLARRTPPLFSPPLH